MPEVTATPAREPDGRTDRIARRTLLGVVGAWTAGGLGVALLGLTGRGASAAAASPVPTHDPRLHAILTGAASPAAPGTPRPATGAGHPIITQPAVKHGDTYTNEFTAGPFGSHMYHSHHNATAQVGGGMLGPLLVAPKDPAVDPRYDKDELFIFNDALGGLTINGK